MRFKEIADGVLVATSDLYLTNTTAVVHGGRVLLIDPAVLPTELDQLADELAQRGLEVELGFATHAHWDHLLWPPALASVPRFAAAWTVETIAAYPAMTHGALRDVSESWYTRWDLGLFAKVQPLPGNLLTWSGPEARVIVHDGHAPGHAALHFPDLALLVAGDMVSDVEKPGLDDALPGDQRQAYLEGLSALESAAPVELFVPGHGRVGDAAELRRRIASDRAYLEEL